jgi:hypothetical protein
MNPKLLNLLPNVIFTNWSELTTEDGDEVKEMSLENDSSVLNFFSLNALKRCVKRH